MDFQQYIQGMETTLFLGAVAIIVILLYTFYFDKEN